MSAASQTALRVVDLVPMGGDKKFEPAGRMAIAIIDITLKNGGCLPQDLNEAGFTPADVYEHWHMAHSLAAVELKLMSEKPMCLKSFLGRK